MPNLLNNCYYQVKPYIPRSSQIFLRRQVVCLKKQYLGNNWCFPQNICAPSKKFLGWPDNKKFALVLTHDVDTARGHEKVIDLLNMEKKLGFRSAFNFVPERYQVSESLRDKIVNSGFEVGVHGLNHDGRLFKSKSIFDGRAKKINHYLKDWQAVGFRAPSMHHNLEWIHSLNIEYDCSTFDIDPFEPQSDGCNSIFPYIVENQLNGHFYIELPYTLPQDFTVFILLKNFNLSIWRRKFDWLVNKGGMVLINTHPDYMSFDTNMIRYDEYSAELYKDFLDFIKFEYQNQYWNALPVEMASFWRDVVSK